MKFKLDENLADFGKVLLEAFAAASGSLRPAPTAVSPVLWKIVPRRAAVQSPVTLF